MGAVARRAQGNECTVLWSPARPSAEDVGAMESGTCPQCHEGDLITISMTVGGRDLSFSTCHHCEAKWWYRDGDPVPLDSVIGLVVEK
jgi:DNA polymerase III alpha subunit (gram-positive type)